jgi:hypothetical protein
MSTTTFTGPVLAGNVLNSDGSGTLASAGGSSGTQNVGFLEAVQSANIVQSATAASTTIVIPAGSRITSIDVFTTVAFTNSATLSIGTTSANANELVASVTVASVGRTSTSPSSGTIAEWLNVGSTQDVQVYVIASAAPSGGTGAATLVVKYMQAFNLYSNGQYT